jgi:hypothetical protein
MPPNHRTSVSRAIRSRDRGLRTVSLATRGLIAASVGAAAAFSAIAAWAQPGRTKISHSSSTARVNRTNPYPQAPAQQPVTPPTQASGDDDNGGETLTPPTSPPDPGIQSNPGNQNNPQNIPQYVPPSNAPNLGFANNPPAVVSGAT